jgi:hypothetical protein
MAILCEMAAPFAANSAVADTDIIWPVSVLRTPASAVRPGRRLWPRPAGS